MQYKIIVDKQPSTNQSEEKKEYVIDIEELRVKGDVYDSLNIEMNRTYVIRRLSLSEYGVLSVLEEPIIQELTDVDIQLFEGDNYIYLMDMQGNNFYAEYLIKNDFNDIYATKNEMNSAITQTAQSIELSVNQKLTGYSTTQEMNSAIQQTAQSITSSVNQTLTNYATNAELEDEVTELNSTITQTASEINLEVSKKIGEDEVCSVISQSADEISLKGNRVVIESNNFNLDKNGNMSCTNANVSGTITSNNANITGGKIKVSGARSATDLLRVENSNSSSVFSYMQPIGAGFVNGGTDNAVYITAGDISGIDIYDNDGTTTLNGSGIRTPKVTQTSLERIKKNISKFTKNATDIINNSDIYEYNLKSDKDEDKKMIGFIIGEGYRTPDEVVSKEGQAVELYSAIGILWKAVQELSARVEQLEKEVQHE